MFGVLDLENSLTLYFVVLGIFVRLPADLPYCPLAFGQVLKAIRENETRATSLGYKADQYKLIAFVLSAALSGLAGSTKSIVFQLASLTDVHWGMSGKWC